jgi:hypothetical protein
MVNWDLHINWFLYMKTKCVLLLFLFLHYRTVFKDAIVS